MIAAERLSRSGVFKASTSTIGEMKASRRVIARPRLLDVSFAGMSVSARFALSFARAVIVRL